MRFNINAPFWRFMDTLLRFVGLNLVYLITLIPNVTIGPARAALYSTMFAYDEHDDIRLVKEYLTRFKREFKQGLAAWVLVVIDVLAAGLSYFVRSRHPLRHRLGGVCEIPHSAVGLQTVWRNGQSGESAICQCARVTLRRRSGIMLCR